MRTKSALPLFIATLFAAVGIWAGCTVEFDTTGEGNTFICESADECIDGQECQIPEGEVEGTCQPEGFEPDGGAAPPCDGTDEGIDQDGDGFGTGPDRTDCGENFSEEDCDDSDDTVYPGAPELCDNKLNNCADWPEDADNGDGEDRFTCGSCDNKPPELSDFFVGCDQASDTCFFLPPVASDDCQNDAGVSSEEELRVTCDSSGPRFTWGSGQEVSALPSSCF